MNENESEKFWSPVLDFHPQIMKLGIQIKLAAAKASKVNGSCTSHNCTLADN